MLDVLKNIIQFLGNMLEWVVDFFQWLVVKVFLLIFEALVFVLGLIPVPEWMESLAGNAAAISPTILYFAAPLQLGTGLAWIVSAYVLRFLIRRLPVIG